MRTLEHRTVRAAAPTIAAADPFPDDLRHALARQLTCALTWPNSGRVGEVRRLGLFCHLIILAACSGTAEHADLCGEAARDRLS